jgi:uncharacterized protein YjbI with pentapeptide repeats
VAVAGVALIRHFAQTDADRQRRITETFSKAIEQLGSEKIEVRLGGVYSLERISKESPNDYWTIMENVAAFIRERSCRMEGERTSSMFDERVSRRAYFLWLEAGRPEGVQDLIWAHAVEREKFGEPPPTDIATALTVVMSRDERSRKRETEYHWCLDFTGAILRKANLDIAHLEGANFDGARLEGASLVHARLEKARLVGAHLEGALLVQAHLEEAWALRAHLERAMLSHAHLERASLDGAHLEEANLNGAYLEQAHIVGAHLEGASLVGAHLERASLFQAHLEGANLSQAHLEGANLSQAHLEGANLFQAHLEGANLSEAHLEGANLSKAHLKEANLSKAHLEGANLSEAIDVSEAHLVEAYGDSSTKLPEWKRMAPPAHWLSQAKVA